MSQQPPSSRVNAAMNLIVATVLRSAKRIIDDLLWQHEQAVNPHPQYRLTVRTLDNTTTGPARTIVVDNGSLTFPTPETARIVSGGGGGSGDLGFYFERNGTQRFVARSTVTYSNAGQSGGGTVTYTKNGSATTLPVLLNSDDVLGVTLTGATTPVATAVTLQAIG